MSTSNLKYSGLAGVGIIWLSVLAGVILARLSVFSRTPLSELGVNPSSKYVFVTGLCLAAILVSLFAMYAYQKLGATVWAPVALITGQLALIGIALTPYTATNFIRPLHIMFGFMSALSIPISMGLFAYTAQSLQGLNKQFFKIGLVFSILGIGCFVIAPLSGALAQMTATITFHLWIITLSLKLR